jgi:hypothetical protein
MRWPWRRHGRRRRTDTPQQPKVDPWAASWGETFLPQPPLRSAAVTPVPTRASALSATVRLGFGDGTEVELDETSGESRMMHAAAAGLISGLRGDGA